MAQTGRRREQQAAGEMAEAEETTKKVVSVMATGTHALVEAEAELLDRVDQVLQRWMESRREANDATRQAIDELQQARDVGDVLRVQQQWWAGAWQRFNADLQALASLTMQYQQRAMTLASETAQATSEQVMRGEEGMLRAAGDKPGESRRG